MSKYAKVMIVLLMGSLWGALELFGGDLLRGLGVPHKSAILFGLGVIILYASKRLVDFAGSVVIMALVAGLFKTASANFYPCQFSAIMINGIVFDGTYRLFKNYLNAGIIFRMIAAPVITCVSYAAFALFATYILREPNWAARGFSGVIDYLGAGALAAALISIATINLGYYLGNILYRQAGSREIGAFAVYYRIVSIVLVAAIWLAGQIY